MFKTAKYLAPLVLACFIGCATMPDKRGAAGNYITFPMLTLSSVGIASLCNLHTYKDADAERTGMYIGMLAGAIAAVGFSAYTVAQSMAYPSRFGLLSIYTIWLVFPLSLSGGGLGAIIGKFFNE